MYDLCMTYIKREPFFKFYNISDEVIEVFVSLITSK
jgi:hypothetical protein